MSESEKLRVAFISHAKEDKERFVGPFVDALRGIDIEGMRVVPWVYNWEIRDGESWAEKIFEALWRADAIVVVLSVNSISSRAVREEINVAAVRRITQHAKVIPVVLDGLSVERIPPALRHIQQDRVDIGEHTVAAVKVHRGIFGLEDPKKQSIGASPSAIYRLAKTPLSTSSLAKIRQLAAGDAEAQNALGVIYAKGEGVPQDYAEAAKWFRRAAEQGNAYAQSLLAYAYETGRGVPQNHAEAAKWARYAAEQGNATAQCNLGAAYGNGKGVAQSDKEAYIWFSLAAAGGSPEAQMFAREAAEMLTSGDLADAQAEADRRHKEIERKQAALEGSGR